MKYFPVETKGKKFRKIFSLMKRPAINANSAIRDSIRPVWNVLRTNAKTAQKLSKQEQAGVMVSMKIKQCKEFLFSAFFPLPAGNRNRSCCRGGIFLHDDDRKHKRNFFRTTILSSRINPAPPRFFLIAILYFPSFSGIIQLRCTDPVQHLRQYGVTHGKKPGQA